MGYDERRFISNIEEEFRCPICHDIIEDPIASRCEHVFCKLCINQWLQKKASCPVDRNSLNSSQLCKPSRFFLNFYFKLEVKCQFESNRCHNVCKIEDLNNHENSCKYNPIFSIVKYECEKGCGALLTIKDEINHNCIEYLKCLNNEQKKELKKSNIKESENKELMNDMKLIVSSQYQEINGLKLKIDLLNEIINHSKIVRKLFFLRMRIFRNSSLIQGISDKRTKPQVGVDSKCLPKPIAPNPHSSSSPLFEEKPKITSIIDSFLASSSEHKNLIESLKTEKWIKTWSVEKVLLSVDRKLFCSYNPYSDSKNSIGFGSTMSAPRIHAFILESIVSHLRNSSSVLDIGCGSGYLTICMAQMVGSNSKVIGIDHVKQLVERSKEILEKNFHYLSSKINFIVRDGRNGYLSEAPYDIINIGGAVAEVPQTILNQLKIGGRLIAPITHDDGPSRLTIIDKLQDGSLKRNVTSIEFSESLQDIETQLRIFHQILYTL